MRAATQTPNTAVIIPRTTGTQGQINTDYIGTFNIFSQENDHVQDVMKQCSNGDWQPLYQRCIKWEAPYQPTAQVTINKDGKSTYFEKDICDPMGYMGAWKVKLNEIVEKSISFESVPKEIVLPRGSVDGVKADLVYTHKGCGIKGGKGSFQMTKLPGWESATEKKSLYHGHVKFTPSFGALYVKKGFFDFEEEYECHFWAIRETEGRLPKESDWYRP